MDEEGKTLVESLREAKPRKVLIVVLDENGQILNCIGDMEIAKLLGFNITEKGFREFLFSTRAITEEDKDTLFATYQLNNPGVEFDIDYLTTTNELWHFHFSFHSFEKGKILVVKDETELTSLKRSLEAERAHLEEEKQHYLDDLNLLAHELRNPLAIIGGFAIRFLRILEKEEALPRQNMMTYLQTIANSATRAEDMLTNIMETERITHGRPQLQKEEIDMYEDVIREVLGYYEIALAFGRKRVVVDHKKSMRKGEAIIFADKRMCRILWRNLIDNALKHIPEEGRLSYGASDKGEIFEFNLYNEGPTIPDEIGERIFEKGFRTEIGHEGFGLGLFLIRQIVGLHGGIVQVEKGRTEGANIVFQLPKK